MSALAAVGGNVTVIVATGALLSTAETNKWTYGIAQEAWPTVPNKADMSTKANPSHSSIGV